MARPRDDLNLAREVITRMDRDLAWDQIKARDVDPKVIEYVQKEIAKGVEPLKVAKSLGIPTTSDRRWHKIQAHIRMGFRGDAEAYLYLQTKRLFRVVEKAKDILEDAIENGVPVVVKNGRDREEIIRVKGATPQLATFLKAYSDVIVLPVTLWKTYGAIGEKRDVGSTGTTIVVQNNIQMPSEKEILDNRELTKRRAEAIEVEGDVIEQS